MLVCSVLLLAIIGPACAATSTYTSVYEETGIAAYGAKYCSGRGIYKRSDKTCACFSNYEGAQCELMVCPRGKAWADIASATDTAHAESVCSMRGECDTTTGLCVCDSGFEGAACQRLSCPDSCNGHGKCMTIGEAATAWNGRNLVRSNVVYTRWDADMIQGCVCDEGWSGYSCAEKDCPKGDDPLTTGQTDEVIRISCQATAGSFYFSLGGYTTTAIAYNTPYGHLELLLGRLPASRGKVTVSFSTGNSVCGTGAAVTTSVTFTEAPGNLPPAKVTAATSLVLTAGTPTLLLETRSVIVCPICTTCTGGILLEYDGEMTSLIPPTSTSTSIVTSLTGLTTLSTASVYGAISSVSVTYSSGTTLCDNAAQITTTISIYSTYGNLPDLVLTNAVYDTGVLESVTITGAKGTKENTYCANRGICDTSTGYCTCTKTLSLWPFTYMRWQSSDGKGAAGTRGDCGYRVFSDAYSAGHICPTGTYYSSLTISTTNALTAICTGRGTCSTVTGACACVDGFYGPDCSLVKCPTGKAWFDEPYANNAAHARGAECSNMGMCNRLTGRCTCRDNFTGAACERMTCPGTSGLTTSAQGCNGHGSCLPMWELAGEYRTSQGEPSAVTYGTSTTTSIPHVSSMYNTPATWDFDMIYGCSCDAPDWMSPALGYTGYTYGTYHDNPRISGWTSYDCSLRTCPTGDNPLTKTVTPVNEIQTVACTSVTTFTLTFRGETTAAISATATTDVVTSALEALSTISTVTVSYSTGTAACGAGITMSITFTGELGDLPPIVSPNGYTVATPTPGTRDDLECSGIGTCDRSTGLCTCPAAYVSSNGQGSAGSRGDCGYYTGQVEVTIDPT